MLPLEIKFDDLLKLNKEKEALLWRSWQLLIETRQKREEELQSICRFIGFCQLTVGRKSPEYRDNLASLEGQAFREVRMLLLQVAPLLFVTCNEKDVPIFAGLVAATQCHGAKSIEQTIIEATTKKEEANKLFLGGEIIQALSLYLQAIAGLAPYSSDASIMSYEQAGKIGLRQIEQALLLNTAVTALQLAKVGLPDQAEVWTTLCIHALWAVELHPFVTHAGVLKRIKLEQEAMKTSIDAFIIENIPFYTRSLKKRGFHANRPGGQWAHWRCDDGHVCA